jgi:thioredoxin 1
MSNKIIKFSASWCGPCKMMKPTFDKVSSMEEFKNIEFISYDIEEDEQGVELVEKYNIRNVPTIVIADEDDEPIKKIIGLVSEKELINLIKDNTNYES